MKWMKRLEAQVDEVLSRWFLSASSPGPTAFVNPWSPGTGPWRFTVNDFSSPIDRLRPAMALRMRADGYRNGQARNAPCGGIS